MKKMQHLNSVELLIGTNRGSEREKVYMREREKKR